MRRILTFAGIDGNHKNRLWIATWDSGDETQTLYILTLFARTNNWILRFLFFCSLNSFSQFQVFVCQLKLPTTMSSPALKDLPKVAVDLKSQLESFSTESLKNASTEEKALLPTAEGKKSWPNWANSEPSLLLSYSRDNHNSWFTRYTLLSSLFPLFRSRMVHWSTFSLT